MQNDPFQYYNKALDIIDGKYVCKNDKELFKFYLYLKSNADLIPDVGPYKYIFHDGEEVIENVNYVIEHKDIENDIRYENLSYNISLTSELLKKKNDFVFVIKIMENFPDDEIEFFEINDIAENINGFCNRILNSLIEYSENQIIDICEYLFSKKDNFELLTLFLNKYKQYDILNGVYELTRTIKQFNFIYENADINMKKKIIKEILINKHLDDTERKDIFNRVIKKLPRYELLELLNEYITEYSFELIINELKDINETEIKNWLMKYIEKKITLCNRTVLWMLNKHKYKFTIESINLIISEINNLNLEINQSKKTNKNDK